MNAKFSIRPAASDAAETLATLHHDSFGMEKWSLEQMQGSLALPTTKAWLAYDGDLPVGFILCQALPEETEILTFCVSTTRRREHIGEFLLRQAMSEAKDGKIFLEVAADNLAARKLYEKLGFTVTGTRVNYYKRGAVTANAVVYSA